MARRRPPDKTSSNSQTGQGNGPVAVVRWLSGLRWATDLLLHQGWRWIRQTLRRLNRRRSRTITYYYDREGRLRACVGPYGVTRWDWDANDPSQATIVTMTQN